MNTQVEQKGTKTVKEMNWSYPSSPNATKFGFSLIGCWTVSTVTGCKPPVAQRGYTSKAEARQYADTLPHEWSASWLQWNKH